VLRGGCGARNCITEGVWVPGAQSRRKRVLFGHSVGADHAACPNQSKLGPENEPNPDWFARSRGNRLES